MNTTHDNSDAVKELERCFDEYGRIPMPKPRRGLKGEILQEFGDTGTDLWEEDAVLIDNVIEFLDEGILLGRIEYDVSIDERLEHVCQLVSRPGNTFA